MKIDTEMKLQLASQLHKLVGSHPIICQVNMPATF